MILVLQGPKGSGKTTLAEAIAIFSGGESLIYVRDTLELPQDDLHLYAGQLLIMDNVEKLTELDFERLSVTTADVIVTTTSKQSIPFLSFQLQPIHPTQRLIAPF